VYLTAISRILHVRSNIARKMRICTRERTSGKIRYVLYVTQSSAQTDGRVVVTYSHITLAT